MIIKCGWCKKNLILTPTQKHNYLNGVYKNTTHSGNCQRLMRIKTSKEEKYARNNNKNTQNKKEPKR